MNSEEKQELHSRIQKVFIAENLPKLDVDIFEKTNLSKNAKIILCEIGVPVWCAPHLHFDIKDGFIKHVNQTKNLHIGSDGEERFLCLNRETEMVSALSVDGHRLKIAKDLLEMIRLLIAYAEFVESHLQSKPDFSFSTSSFSEPDLRKCIEKLEQECPNIMETRSWWKDIFTMMIEQTKHP